MFSLHVAEVTNPAAAPRRFALILHGIYGRGGNWRTLARTLVERCPEWGILLADLRMHGKSQGAPPPHTLAACADDVVAVLDQRAQLGQRIERVIGHSFGGKVALLVRRKRPLSTWVLDSAPGKRSDSELQAEGSRVVAILELLERLPTTYTDREEFVGLVQSAGIARPLAQWLAMNLERHGESYDLAIEPVAMRELLSDYFAVDGWDTITEVEAPLHYVVATRASSLTDEEKVRLKALRLSHLSVHEVDSGHWVHVEAFDELAQLLTSDLCGHSRD